MTLFEKISNIPFDVKITVIDNDKKGKHRMIKMYEYIQEEYSKTHEVIKEENLFNEVKLTVRSIKK